MKVKYIRSLNQDDLDNIDLEDISTYDKIVKIKGDAIKVEDIKSLNKGDIFVVDTLNVLGFNSSKNLNLIKKIHSMGIGIEIINYGVINNSKIKELEILLEYEKNCMVERLKNAKHIAKQTKENFRDGRPREYVKEVEEYVVKLINEGRTYTEIVKITGISRATISRIRNRNSNEIQIKK